MNTMTHRSELIKVQPREYYMSIFKACGAMWQVCYGQLWPFGGPQQAKKKIGDATYLVKVQGTPHEYIGFEVTICDGIENPADVEALEAELLNQYREIQQRKLRFARGAQHDESLFDD